MICPVEFTHELSALKKRRGILEVENLTALLRSGNGADDEITRRAIEGDGEEDHLVGGSGNHRSDGSDDAPLAGAETRGGAVTIRTTTIGPIIALVAGILILLVPRVLNYVVAVYLILIGLIGLFGV